MDPLLLAAEVDTLRQITSDWMVQQGAAGGVDWSVPDGQPYCLHALAAFGAAVGDKDVALWPALLHGVPTGFDNDIPASNVFAPRCVPPSDEDLQIYFCNWGGAEAEPALLAELVQKELTAGYIEEVSSLADAQERWGDKLAVGRMNVVKAEGRKPRLVVDSSICNTNSACVVNEAYSLPSLQSVRHSFPLRGCTAQLAAFSLDIEAAHKTVRVRESDRGLLGIQMQVPGQPLRFFFYKVCPFGAVFLCLLVSACQRVFGSSSAPAVLGAPCTPDVRRRPPCFHGTAGLLFFLHPCHSAFARSLVIRWHGPNFSAGPPFFGLAGNSIFWPAG